MNSRNLLTAIAAIGIPASAHAALINGQTIAFDYQSGAPGSAGADANSNVTFSTTFANAVDTTGTPTGVSATIGNFVNSNNDAINSTATAPTSPFSADQLRGYIVGTDDNNPQTITFANLNDSLTYDFAFAAGTSNAGFADFQVSASADGKSVGPISSIPTADSWGELKGLSTNGSGVLVISFTSGLGGGADTVINAVQLTAVPEPSSLALLGLGGLLIARRRRG